MLFALYVETESWYQHVGQNRCAMGIGSRQPTENLRKHQHVEG